MDALSRPRLYRRIAALSALTLVAAAALAAGASAQIGRTSSAGLARPWAAQYMNGAETVSAGEAVAAAKEFDVIAALPRVYKPYVGQMKAANPSLLLFVYLKGVFTYDTTLPEAAYAHDAHGLRITGLKFPGTWLLDPTSPVAVTTQIAAAKDLLALSGYDGVFLDTLGPAVMGDGYVTTPPVNPATGQVWTVGGWVGATAALAGKIAAGVGKPVMGNGLRNGPNYFGKGATTSRLLQTGMGGAMAEAWLRDASARIDDYPSEAEWKLNVDAIADAGAHGGSFFAVTKVWTIGLPTQKSAWYKFAVASFLLANDGKAYFTFTEQQGDATAARSLDKLDLGAPQGAYAKIDNVYQRSFSDGRVLVNPSDSTYTVPLGGIYFTVEGIPVTSVTLPPHTAEILKRSL